ncbi:hypothetical protein TYRP_022124 [Tyrophagus putrescentiae]|nr:hypothetical protein TYRP_022124 [Tyrophagus putrescentiae]
MSRDDELSSQSAFKPPLPLPDGWIPILESSALKLNQVQSVVALGRELAVVRGGTGTVTVLDAFCPHLGANLGVGGVVHQENEMQSEKSIDCIRCPFHHWSFRLTDGRCSHIPYAEAPVDTGVRLWPAIEVNNFIFVWHCQTSKNRQNSDEQRQFLDQWKPEALPSLASKQLSLIGRLEYTVNCHAQEMVENIADVAHFPALHGAPLSVGADLGAVTAADKERRGQATEMITFEVTQPWTQSPSPNGHCASTQMGVTFSLFGWTLYRSTLTINGSGPSYLVSTLKASLLGGLFTVQSAILDHFTPVGTMKTHRVSHVYSQKGLFGYLMGKITFFAAHEMFKRDIFVWNRKAYVRRPPATKEEKSLVKFRRYYSQFYASSKGVVDW